MGDLIVSLPALQWLIKHTSPVYLVLRSPMQEGFQSMVPGLAGSVREADFLAHGLPDGTRYINLRQHPLQTDFMWGTADFESKYPGFKIVDIVDTICQDFGIQADFENLEPLPCRIDAELKQKIAVIPGSGGPFKCWDTESWQDVLTRFGDLGLEFVILGKPDQAPAVQALIDSGMPHHPTPTLSDALSAVSSVRCVVTVDTGLLHLALHQGTPTVGLWLNNPGSLNFLRRLKHSLAIITPECIGDCIEAQLALKSNTVTEWPHWYINQGPICNASAEQRCMNYITPEHVVARTMEALALSTVSASL